MHVHGNPMLNSAAIHSAGAAEKAASATRASETRRKLLESASAVEGGLDSGSIFMIAGWPEGSSGREQNRPQHDQTGNRRADRLVAEEEPISRPISVWA